jgi:dihydrofolate reductase
MPRVTYEGMAAHWSTAEGAIADFMNGVRKVVFSSTLAEVDWENNLRHTPIDLEHLETRQLGPRCTLLRYRSAAG